MGGPGLRRTVISQYVYTAHRAFAASRLCDSRSPIPQLAPALAGCKTAVDADVSRNHVAEMRCGGRHFRLGPQRHSQALWRAMGAPRSHDLESRGAGALRSARRANVLGWPTIRALYCSRSAG